MSTLRRFMFVSAVCMTVVPAIQVLSRALGEEYVLRLHGKILALEADLALQELN